MLGSRRRLAAIFTASATLIFWFGTPHHAIAQNDPAGRALQYLATQQLVNGSIANSDTLTEQTAIAVAADGFDPSSFALPSGQSLMAYLQTVAATDQSNPGKTGELVQAVVAAKLDPTNFAGIDLIKAINSTYDATTGEYQVTAEPNTETFNQALAMLGLRSAGETVPAAAINYLRLAQDSDGGWNYLAQKDSSQPFAGSDTNSTAIALMALDASGDHDADQSALQYFHAQQDQDGGFPFQTGAGTDPDSTALVIQAILAAEQDPTGCGWAQAGITPYKNLVDSQSSNGGYVFPGYASPDALTTAQVPIALLLQPFTAAGTFASAFTLSAEQNATHNALLYLQSQQSTTDGSVNVGFATFAPTEDYIIAAAAAGYDPTILQNGTGPTAIQYLENNAAAASSASAGAAGKLVQAIVAARLNPQSFGGVNVVAALQGFYTPATGAYGDGGAFSQSLAVLGLVASGNAVPAAAIADLQNNQDSDGGWNYLLQKDSTAAFASSDTNSTALVLMALDATGIHSEDTKALQFLKSQQQTDGGFPLQGSGSDPDSDALVLQALVAAHQDLAASGWTDGGATVLINLLSDQAASGGFIFPGSADADAFTTSQVPAGLERVPFPVVFTSDASAWTAGTTLSSVPSSPVTPDHEAALQGCNSTSTPTATPILGLIPPISTTKATPSPAPIAVVQAPESSVTANTPTPIPDVTAAPSPSATPTITGGVQALSTETPASTPSSTNSASSWLYVVVGLVAMLLVLGAGLVLRRRRI